MKKILISLIIGISLYSNAQKINPLTQGMADDLYNSLDGPSWEVTLKDGTVINNLTNNWLKELKGERIEFDMSAISGSKTFTKIDLTNSGLKGEMSEQCFTQPLSLITNSNDKKKYKQDYYKNENDNSLISTGYRDVYFYFSYNEITKISKDITAVTAMSPNTLKLDHNNISEFPDFEFTKLEKLGGIYQKTGIKHLDVSYNEISKIEKEHFYFSNDTKSDRGVFNMASNTLDVSNNRLNFRELIKLQEIAIITMATYETESFVYAPQKPLGTSSEQTLKEGSNVKLSFILEHKDNKYRWFLNGKFTGFTGTELEIKNLSPDEAGIYTCRVTNVNLPELEIESKPMAVYLSGNDKVDDFTLSSNSAAPGYGAFKLAIGEFQGQPGTYFRLKDQGQNHSFRIINNQLMNAEELFDHYSIDEYNITVEAYNIYGDKKLKTFKIVNDGKMQSTMEALYHQTLGNDLSKYQDISIRDSVEYILDVPENTPVGFDVSEVFLNIHTIETDIAPGVPGPSKNWKAQNVKYYLKNEYDNKHFELSGNTLKTKKEFNYEIKNKYTVEITSEFEHNTHKLSFKTLLEINITDVPEAPHAIIITNNQMNINQSIGSIVGYISYIDEDLNPSPAVLSCDGTDFKLDGNILKLNSKVKVPKTIDVKITAKRGNLVYSEILTIYFIDPNKNMPPTGIFLENMTLNKGIQQKDVVSKIVVLDPDTQEKFVCSVDNPLFSVQNNHLLYNGGTIKEQNQVNIEVTDKANNKFSKLFNIHKEYETPSPIFITDTVEVFDTVEIDKIIEVCPEIPFSQIGLTNLILSENWDAGTIISKILNDGNEEIDYQIMDYKDHKYFIISGNEIILNNKLDSEQTLYEIKINAISDSRSEAYIFNLFIPTTCGNNNILDVSSLEIELYPNPSSDIVHVDKGDTYYIFDDDGSLIKSSSIISHQIDVSDLSNGMYIIKIFDKYKSYSTTFMKQ